MRCALNVLSLIGCAIILISVDAGKDVLVRIHVPQLIKHKHHTKVVFVHPPIHKHHSHLYESPHEHYHHNYNHRYSYKHHNYGGDYLAPKYEIEVKPAHRPELHKYKPKKPTQQPTFKTNKHPKDEAEYFNVLGRDLRFPNVITEHYKYVTSLPSYEFDDDNNLKEINKTIKHEYTKIETVGDFHDVENSNDFPKIALEDHQLHPLYFHASSPDKDDYRNYRGYGTENRETDHYDDTQPEEFVEHDSVQKLITEVRHEESSKYDGETDDDAF